MLIQRSSGSTLKHIKPIISETVLRHLTLPDIVLLIIFMFAIEDPLVPFSTSSQLLDCFKDFF